MIVAIRQEGSIGFTLAWLGLSSVVPFATRDVCVSRNTTTGEAVFLVRARRRKY